jgi:disulfide bond formation protein DsbB
MSNRIIALISVLMITALLLFSVYLQVFQNILPCPLCSLQRITFIILAVLFLLAACFYKKVWARIFFGFATGLFSIVGILLAGRQVYLQHFPHGSSNECGASLQYMMQVFSWNELIGKILEGSADCAKVEWELLHLDMAEWALIWFILFLFVSVAMLLREFKHKFSHDYAKR